MRFFSAAPLLVALFVSSQANATSFVEISVNENLAMSIDADSVKERGGYLTAWYLQNELAGRREYGELSAKMLYRIDCSSESTGLISMMLYSEHHGAGRPLESVTNEPHQIRMLPKAPDTVGFQMVSAACHIANKGSLAGFSPRVDVILQAFEDDRNPDHKLSEAETAKFKCVVAKINKTIEGENAGLFWLEREKQFCAQ